MGVESVQRQQQAQRRPPSRMRRSDPVMITIPIREAGLGPASEAGAWLLISAIVTAPWMMGSRPYWASYVLIVQIALAFGMWAVGSWQERRKPRVPAWCAVGAGLLVVYAWIGILNWQSIYDARNDRFLSAKAFVSILPSTVDAGNSAFFAAIVMASLLAMVMTVDLASYAAWRRRILQTIAATGFTVVVAGLLLKSKLFPAITDYLAHRPWAQGVPFGPFDYHGNAGTFINLVIPAMALGAAWTQVASRRALWLCGLCLCYVALCANPSRVALLIGLGLLPVVVWISVIVRRQIKTIHAYTSTHRAFDLGVLGAGAACVAALLTLSDSSSVERMRTLQWDLATPDNPRYMQQRAAQDMTRQYPLLGAGVGSYKLLVQHSASRGHFFAPSYRPGQPFTVLSHVHNDYLQTLVEWGRVGGVLWALLAGAALLTLFARLVRWRQIHWWMQASGLAALVALVGLLAHAAVDCPLQCPSLQLYGAIYLGLAAARAPEHALV